MIHQVKIITNKGTFFDDIQEDVFTGDVLDIISVCDKYNNSSPDDITILFKDKKYGWISHAPYVSQLD